MPEHVTLYEKARALLYSAIPANPEQRPRRQQDYTDACEALHSALRRQPNQEDVMAVDLDDPEPSPFIVRHGPAAVADFEQALAIRRRLEQLYQGRRR